MIIITIICNKLTNYHVGSLRVRWLVRVGDPLLEGVPNIQIVIVIIMIIIIISTLSSRSSWSRSSNWHYILYVCKNYLKYRKYLSKLSNIFVQIANCICPNSNWNRVLITSVPRPAVKGKSLLMSSSFGFTRETPLLRSDVQRMLKNTLIENTEGYYAREYCKKGGV